MKTLQKNNMLKTLALFLLIGLLNINVASAQRWAYVDTEYILDKIPEYKEAQKKIDAIAEEWNKQIQKKYNEVEQLYKNFQAEQVLLTESMKEKKIQEIEQKEKEAKDLQNAKFGVEGELFKKRQELIKPIQDKIYDAIKKLAELKAYNFIFDKSNGITMLYFDTKYDKSNDILKALGYPQN